MRIDAGFDAGNIEVASDPDGDQVELEIRADNRADFRQWFHFQAEGVRGRECRFEFVNANETTYPDALEEYRVCASYDRKRWFRVPTHLEDGRLVVEHTPHTDRVAYAYFAPYSLERHARLLKRAARFSHVAVQTLGRTVEGRDLQLVVLGEEEPARRRIWVSARQHPGETMAEWFAEGLLERLFDEDDPVVRSVLSRATVYLVPNMNPDGSFLGNLRSNAAGANLNRAWLEPSATESPEVLCVRERMKKTGVDLFLDIHGDERNPYCFLAGCEGNPNYSERLRFLENRFEQTLVQSSPDFQDTYGYERDEPGGGDLRTASNWVGQEFDCLSYTLEMPFKDNQEDPDETSGWSPERAMHLGDAALEALEACIDVSRGPIPDMKGS